MRSSSNECNSGADNEMALCHDISIAAAGGITYTAKLTLRGGLPMHTSQRIPQDIFFLDASVVLFLEF